MSAFLRQSAHLRKLYIASRQILRLSNVNKKNALISVSPGIRPCVSGGCMVVQRNLATVAPKYENGEEPSTYFKESSPLSANEYIDHILSKLDSDAKKYGNVLRKDVESVLDRIKISGIVSSIQGLYLIRCCGFLLADEPPAMRLDLLHKIWSILQELKVPMDASHYNSLIKSYLENDHQFSPPEFLAMMENAGVAPNRVTYQRAIEKYCNDGDLSGASAILEYMKEKELPINEGIFNSLVLGHTRAKDMKGAVNILDVMRNSQLEPTSETYTTLACGFAENGDLENFSNVLREAKQKDLYFSGKNYLQLLASLPSSEDEEILYEIIGKISLLQHKPEVMNIAINLVNRGYDDAAYRIISALHQKLPTLSFLKALSLKDYSLEKMIKYCKDIYSTNVNDFIFEDAAKIFILHGKLDYALEMYKEMREMGRSVRCHYFWPILSIHHKNGNVEGIWSTLKFMSDIDLPADTDTYLDYVLPSVLTSEPETVIAKVKELGQSDEQATDAVFQYYCFNGQIQAAIDFCTAHKPLIHPYGIINSLASSKQNDVESVVRLLKHIKQESDLQDDLFGLFLSRLLFYQRNNIPVVERFIKECNIQGVKLQPEFVERLCYKLKDIAPELVRLVQNLEINVIRDKDMNSDQYIPVAGMNLEKLEDHLVYIKETGGNVRPVLRHLLSHHCRQKNINRVMEIIAELNAIDYTYSPATYAILFNLFVSFNNLEEATKYKKAIDEEYSHFKLDATKAIDYIALMIKNDKADEAFELIKSEAQDWVPPRYADMLSTSIKNVLHIAADTGNVEITGKLVQMLLLDLKLIPIHHTVLEPLIKVHLVRNDWDGAIEEYRNCIVSYKAFPSRNFLFKKFITLKDPERLQKVVDISTTYGSKEIALHELAAAFIESGCVQEARKVMQTLGTKADMKWLDSICYRFFKQEKCLELEQFISITKDFYHIDRDQLYSHLLNLYAQTNDHQSALEVWNVMQEENIQPSASILQKLADLLEKNDQPIPFIIPSQPSVESMTVLKNLLAEKNEVETVNILRSMKKGEIHVLTPDVFTNIVDLLLEKKCLKQIVDIVQVMSCILAKSGEILKPVAKKYGAAGDVNALKSLHDCMPEFVHSSMSFGTNLFEAYIVSGKPEELLDDLEQNVETAKRIFSLNGFLNLLERYPELLDRATKLADLYLEKESFFAPKMILWLHYFLQENYEKADEIYKQNSGLFIKSDFPFMRIMQTVRKTQNEQLGRKLIDVANDTLKTNIQSRAYSCLLDILVHNEKLQEALQLIEEANSKGIPTGKFLQSTLLSLKKFLTEKNVPVPFVIPFEGEDSSSSSDSD